MTAIREVVNRLMFESIIRPDKWLLPGTRRGSTHPTSDRTDPSFPIHVRPHRRPADVAEWWWRRVIAKQSLAISYLAGSGVGLSVAVIARLWYYGNITLLTALGTASGVLLALSLVYAAYWLRHSSLDDDQVWTVSIWAGGGIALTTAISIAYLLMQQANPAGPVAQVGADVLASNIAAGGAGGVALGSTRELSKEHESVQLLSQQNAVMNRIFRHNIRNTMNTVLLQTEALEARVDEPAAAHHLTVIRDQIDEVVTLSDQVRQAEAALSRAESVRRTVDLVPVCRRQLDALARSDPSVTVDRNLPATATVRAHGLIEAALENVFENAVEHNDRAEKCVTVTVTPVAGGGAFEVRVADNGPGIPTESIDVIERGFEDSLNHLHGLGLWLVAWIVRQSDGELAFAENEPRGTIVSLRLPSASGAGLGPIGGG